MVTFEWTLNSVQKADFFLQGASIFLSDQSTIVLLTERFFFRFIVVVFMIASFIILYILPILLFHLIKLGTYFFVILDLVLSRITENILLHDGNLKVELFIRIAKMMLLQSNILGKTVDGILLRISLNFEIYFYH